MTDDGTKYQSIINKKCPSCYVHKEGGCMLTPHMKATLCLGPFKDLQDRMEKVKASHEVEKPKEDTEGINRYVRKRRLDDYLLKRAWFNYNPEDEDAKD